MNIMKDDSDKLTILENAVRAYFEAACMCDNTRSPYMCDKDCESKIARNKLRKIVGVEVDNGPRCT